MISSHPLRLLQYHSAAQATSVRAGQAAPHATLQAATAPVAPAWKMADVRSALGVAFDRLMAFMRSILTPPAPGPAPAPIAPTPSPAPIDASAVTIGPGQSIAGAISKLKPGQTLVLRGGTYVETVSVTPPAGVTIRNAPGERPVIQGLVRIRNPQALTWDGINVTWDPKNGPHDHMVKFSGGSDWKIINSEFWGARSFANLLISDGARNFYVGHNRIHDTFPSNDKNQDHNIYINQADGGVLEHNLLYNSPNGRAIKVGSLTSEGVMPRGVIIRYNTMYNNLGPSNVQFSYAANNNQLYGNLMVKPGSGRGAVTGYGSGGGNNVVRNNAVWEAKLPAESNPLITDGGGNMMIDPQFDANFRPRNPAAQVYGHTATEHRFN